MYFLAYNENEFKGFYMEGIHKNIPSPNIIVTEALHEFLISLQDFKLVDYTMLEDRVYDLDDKILFEAVLPEMKQGEPTEVDLLSEQNAQLVMDSAIKNAQIEQLNQTVSELIMSIAQGGN